MRLRGGGGGSAAAASTASIDGKGKGEGEGNTKGRRMPRVWLRYLDALERRPLLTKALSTGVIDGTANMIEQTLSPAPFVSLGLDLGWWENVCQFNWWCLLHRILETWRSA